MLKRVFLQLQRVSINVKSEQFLKFVMPFYAVARGRSVGIYEAWGDCEAQVKGFSGARYKKFDTPYAAQDFINAEGGSAPPKSNNYNQSAYGASSSKISNGNNLKRNYSTSSSYYQTNKNSNSKSNYGGNTNDSSDDSDDLTDIVIKQMDDIEKRANSFGKGIDKIYKKSGGRKAIMIEPPEPKRRRTNDREFDEDDDGYVRVYTDGACSNNGTQSARAGLGVYWGDGHSLNTSEPVSGRATNNCGEIQAANRAIKQAIQNGITKLEINTDSKFLIDSVTKWMPGWKRKGWTLKSGEPVKNEIDFKELDSLQNKLQVKWKYVEAHKGIHGNEKADQLARAGAALYKK